MVDIFVYEATGPGSKFGVIDLKHRSVHLPGRHGLGLGKGAAVMAIYSYVTLDDPSATENTFAYGINSLGQIVGTFSVSYNYSYYQGFLYSSGTWTTLDDPNAGNGSDEGTFAQAINDSGQIVGFYWDSNYGLHGFLYSNGTWTTLDDPSSDGATQAFGINATGEIVGTFWNGINDAHGFLYNNGTWTTLADPSAVYETQASGINDSGQIVGYYLDSNFADHGFLYSSGTWTTLDDPNAGNGSGEGTFAQGINDFGPDRWVLFRQQRRPPRLPLQRRHLHHAGRSLDHPGHRCGRHQRFGPDRRLLWHTQLSGQPHQPARGGVDRQYRRERCPSTPGP